ncbi:site-specific integrase [Arthrobacter sp. MDT3-44]
MLPGRSPNHGNEPVCVECAGITQDYHCTGCGTETEHYRRGICARCSLRDDLTVLLGVDWSDPNPETTTAGKLLTALCAAQRPESILTWLRRAGVRDLLRRLATGEIPCTHEALDKEPNIKRAEHLRSLLVHHNLLPARDHYLSLFERWLTDTLEAIDDPDVRRPVESFARWHHLHRIRNLSANQKPTRGPVHNARQDINQTIRFLTWLKSAHGRAIASCTQPDVDAWLAEGPTSRHAIKTFFGWAVRNRTCTHITIRHRQARTVPMLTQDQRLAWLKACLTSGIDTLPYRVAGALLLLYAQPVVKIVAMKSTDVILAPDGVRLSLGQRDPVPVPEPFAALLKQHLASRPNLRTAGRDDSQWLFPGYRAGNHLHPTTVQNRLAKLGINVIGARNAALRGLTSETPAPLVAEMLGYSYKVTQQHATETAAPWSRYITSSTKITWYEPR